MLKDKRFFKIKLKEIKMFKIKIITDVLKSMFKIITIKISAKILMQKKRNNLHDTVKKR